MANRINVSLGLDTTEFQRAIKGVERTVQRFGTSLATVGRELSTSLTLPLGLAARAAITSFAQIDKLRKGMIAMTGSAEAADAELAKLREVAKLPGLGFEEAIKGSISLQAVGLSADEARQTLLGFGKALAVTGGGKNELDRIQVQLTQMISKNKLLAEDYKVIQSLLPLMGDAMERTFGTRNIEKIREMGISAKDFALRLSGTLNTMPQVQNVTGGLANAFENFGDTLKIVGSQFGQTISNALNLENVLAKVATAIQDAADWFAGLSKETQKMIVYAGVFAVAIGPVLFVVGKLSGVFAAALSGVRALAAGFAFITSPVGLVVAAIAALTYVFADFTNEAKSASKAFEDQEKKVKMLDSSITPLVDRYEELKKKTNLTKEEQDELKKIIADIGKAVPGAVTEFDKYGVALDINAGKVRTFTADQKKMLAVLNADAIRENEKALKDLEAQHERLSKTLNDGTAAYDGIVRKGDKFFRQVADKGKEGLGIKLEEVSGEAVDMLAGKLKKFQDEIDGTRLLIKQYKGEIEAPAAIPEETKKTKITSAGSGEAQKGIKSYLAVAIPGFQALGGAMDKINAGFRPLVKNNQDVVAPLMETNSALKQTTTLATALGGIRTSALQEDLKQNAELWTRVKDRATEAWFKMVAEAEKNAPLMQQILSNLNAGLTQIVNEGLANLVTGFAEGIGQLAQSGGGIQSVFANILGVIGNAMEQFGKLIIAAGIAALNLKIALKSFGAAAGAIIAGTALLALSKIVQAKAKSITPLAKGGLAFGPTLALVGDNPGARNDPEVIAPFSKLEKMMGGGSGAMQLTGVFEVRGQDLLLVLDRAQVQRSRVR